MSVCAVLCRAVLAQVKDKALRALEGRLQRPIQVGMAVLTLLALLRVLWRHVQCLTGGCLMGRMD